MVRRIATLALAAAAIFATQTPSQALQGAGCQAKGDASFSPAMVNVKSVLSYSLTGVLKKCRSLDGITTGTITINGTGEMSCKKAGTSAGTIGITWNDGSTSGGTFDVNSVGPHLVFQGKIDVGRYSGPAETDGFEMVAGVVTIPSDCAAGLTSASWTGEIGIGNIA